jgi:hypothetical protein
MYLNKVGVSLFSKNMWLSTTDQQLYFFLINFVKILLRYIINENGLGIFFFRNRHLNKKVNYYYSNRISVTKRLATFYTLYLIQIGGYDYIIVYIYFSKNKKYIFSKKSILLKSKFRLNYKFFLL